MAKQCTRCIMDSTNDPDLQFNEIGVCNHCLNFEKAIKSLPEPSNRKKQLHQLIDEIKLNGKKNSKYDCIIGVSGGVDSTYLCYVAKEHGLRALLVHCDNGWNSELSVMNIQNICKLTGYELYTLVIDWEEMRDLQLSFMKAGVVDLELPYDYALTTTVYKAAKKYGISSILTGHNVITEGSYLPQLWRHDKNDILNILDIHRQYGKVKLKTFPKYRFFTQILIKRKLKYYFLLNYLEYNKEQVKDLITKQFSWRDYGGKHYENIFTRFYQGYILKEKFGFDKRQFHLSVLVQSGQLSREEALREYSKPAYDQKQLEEDKQYVLKKLGMTEEDFRKYMQAPTRKHQEFDSIKKYWDFYFSTIRGVKRVLRRSK